MPSDIATFSENSFRPLIGGIFLFLGGIFLLFTQTNMEGRKKREKEEGEKEKRPLLPQGHERLRGNEPKFPSSLTRKENGYLRAKEQESRNMENKGSD